MPDVLHATAWFPPYNLGGTEVYLEGLVGELAAHGVSSNVVVPRSTGAPESYIHNGTFVSTYWVNDRPAPEELHRGKAHDKFDTFLAVLKKNRDAIYHQHSWTRGCGAPHLRAAREFGVHTVLTVHVPGNICLRGTMMRFGETPCDGLIQDGTCGACWAEERGAPRSIAQMLGRVPTTIANKIGHPLPRRLATALAARALAAQKRQALVEMVANADRVVAVCQWLYDALALNGVPKKKLVLSRQGIAPGFAEAIQQARHAQLGGGENAHIGGLRKLRLLYLGRWHPVKGVEVVARAIRALPREVAVELTIHAIAGGAEEAVCEEHVREIASDSTRIHVRAAVPRDELPELMLQFDALVVPSLWLETGPLVVLEAQAAGLFVIGSRLGGIAELVDEKGLGLLVPPGDVSAWGAAITECADRRAKGDLGRELRQVRPMADAAADMARLYQELA